MRIIKKALLVLTLLIGVCLIIFLLGPTPPKVIFSDTLPKVKSLEYLDFFVLEENSKQKLKLDNGSQLIWANDSLRNQTEYVLVYLHGLSASPEEGEPIHRAFAKRYGMNAYFPRISGHGLDVPEPLIDLDASDMLRSAEEALAVGKQLGKKVIIMSCSTGSTLSIYLASQFPNDVYAQIMYSPNIDIDDPNSIWLTRPWGLQVARLVFGSDYREWSPGPEAKKYWYSKYRLEATVALKALINATMTKSTFSKVNQPLLLSYYYKNEEEKDHTVSIDRMTEMFAQISTPTDQKEVRPLANVGHHCMASKYFSKDLASVKKVTFDFAEQVLTLKAIE